MIKYLLVFFTFLNFVNCQNYSYYKLGVQKWCTNEYQIHGLWPQFSSDEYPSYCNKDPYIQPSGLLEKEMIKYWSSCNNTDLWEHEWIKHGTCYEESIKNDVSRLMYFLYVDVDSDFQMMPNDVDAKC